MTPTLITYTLYLLISVTVTVWVARTLFRNGHVFLIDCFKGNKELADSVNHLLVVGFYLMNIGFVTLYLRVGYDIDNTQAVFEALSQKVGVVLLALGAMHFFNIYVFNRLRRRALEPAPRECPPVAPTTHVEPPALNL